MKIIRLIGGNLESNGYILYEQKGGQAFIIDPGYNPDLFLKKLHEMSLTLKGIFLTHHHYDHTGAVDKIKNATDCPVYIHNADADMLKKSSDTILLSDGMQFELETEVFDIINTPGHTKGGICILNKKQRIVFTGDTLFDNDLGRTDLSDGSEQSMKNTIRNIVSNWENDIVIYPGHGNSVNMKFVKEHNLEYQEIMKH